MKATGYFIGVTVGSFLMFALISFIFFSPRKVSDLQLKNIINNNIKINIYTVPLITVFDTPVPDKRLGRKNISKTTFFSNRNMSYVTADTYTFYCDKLNKYVRTYSISEIGNMTSIIKDFGDKDKDKSIYPDMYFYYNETQNADPSFGTIDKPLPILFFKSSNPALRSMRQKNRDADPVYLKRIYEENVKLYLQYFIDKKDFKKLFPDK